MQSKIPMRNHESSQLSADEGGKRDVLWALWAGLYYCVVLCMCSLDCVLALPEWDEWTFLPICLKQTTTSQGLFQRTRGERSAATLTVTCSRTTIFTSSVLGLAIFLSSDIFLRIVWEEQTSWNTFQLATFGTEAWIGTAWLVRRVFRINSFIFLVSSPVLCQPICNHPVFP